MEECIKKSRVDPSGAAVQDLTPIPRHELWKAARTRSGRQMTSESASLIAHRIVSHIIYILQHFQLCIVIHIIVNYLL